MLGVTLYIANSNGAIDFYCNAFKLELGYNVKNDDGTYLHAELYRQGFGGFAISESKDKIIQNAMLVAKQPTISLGMNFDDNKELDYAYDALSKDGHIIRPIGSLPWSPYSADLVDKFGVCWYLYVTQYRPE